MCSNMPGGWHKSLPVSQMLYKVHLHHSLSVSEPGKADLKKLAQGQMEGGWREGGTGMGRQVWVSLDGKQLTWDGGWSQEPAHRPDPNPHMPLRFATAILLAQIRVAPQPFPNRGWIWHMPARLFQPWLG